MHRRPPNAEKASRSDPSQNDAVPHHGASHPHASPPHAGTTGAGHPAKPGHAGGHPGGHPMSAPKTIDAFFVPAGRDPLTQAFSGREFSPPWRGSVAIDPAEAGSAVARAFATPRAESAAVYINVPYCQSRCLFCGFFQNVWRPELSDAYVNDVIAEMEEMVATPLVSTAPIESVYLGGGTPSALLSVPLARLIANVRRLLPLDPECEITVEGRAYGFGLEKAVAAFDAGANRVSLGVQTFDTAVRRRLGRKLDGAATLAFLNDLAALDRASIVCDLMYGLPGQSREIWRRDIETVASSRIDGVTLYALNIFRGGPLAKSIADEKLPPAAPVGEQAQMYAEAAEFLVAEGFRQVSQSHFARGNRERNRYNSGIKRGVPCIPFGPGAGGQAHGVRWSNLVSIEERKAAKAEGQAPIAGASRMPPAYAAQAAITAGLEAGSLPIDVVDAIAPGFARAAAPLLDNWTAAGLGRVDGSAFRATRAGTFWITNLTGGLYAALDAIPHTVTATEEIA
ncbi:heme anaerobic degradation radical SAM methyltransferase ChuW/HutW [Rhodomicrobium vannielii]|uniref:heme anaerobic degradation radical SAM methyltransferase ChuW/HutW n=1 Tax=Rhodomicrobium vannielii TaxID=1069 RepID=UPI0031BB7DEB